MATQTTETPEEALARIQSMGFGKNDAIVIMAFSDRGIPPEDIDPRHNVLTFRAWTAAGRQVAKGSISVEVTTWIPCKDSKKDTKEGEEPGKRLRPKTARVFHVSQTIPKDSPKGTRPEAWNNPALVREGTYAAPEEPESTDKPISPPVDIPKPSIVREEVLELNESGELETVEEWTTDTPHEQIDREMAAALNAPDKSSVEAIEESVQACNCPMAGYVTNVDCPIHGGRVHA